MMEAQKTMYLRGHAVPQSQIITVAGGKGGIGKSFVSSSVAIFLANLGYKTVIVDLDLGCANLHTYLNINKVDRGLFNFITSGHLKIEDLIIPTKFSNLGLITSNDPDDFDSSQINMVQKSKIMSALFKLKADYIIFDLSAGTQELTLDFYLMGTKNILVTTPEPSSIENAYRFIKSSFYRKIKRLESQYNLKPLIAEIMGNKEKYNVRCPHDLLKNLYKRKPEEALALYTNLNKFAPHFVLNQTRAHKDLHLGDSIKSVSRKYFGLNSEFLGAVSYDNAVWQSLRNRSHLLVEYPSSQLYAQLMGVTKNLIHNDLILRKAA